MGNVLHRTSKAFLQSVNTPDYDSGTYAINPAGTAALIVATVPTKYWKLTGTHPAETASEMNAAEKAAVDDVPATLAALKVVRLAEIDGVTQDIVDEGFLHDAKIFGLAVVDISDFRQWREKVRQGTDTYAKLWVLKDGTSYSIASRAVFLQIAATYMEALEAAYTGGLTLRSDIADAVDDAAVDAVVDSRTVEKYTPGGTPERGPFDSKIPLLANWDAGAVNLRAAGFSAGGVANASAILTLLSTVKGFLPPSMTTTQRDAIGSPAAGLIIWNSTTVQHEKYNGTAWAAIGGSGGGDLMADGTVPMTGPWAFGGQNISGMGDIVPKTDLTEKLGSTTIAWLDLWIRNIKSELNDTRISFATALTTFNSAGADIDLQVESVGDAVSFFVDASTKRVGVGASLADRVAKLNVRQNDATGAIPVLYLQQDDASEEMIQMFCTIGTGNAIEAVGGKTLTPTHFIKMTIPGGLTRHFAVGTLA